MKPLVLVMSAFGPYAGDEIIEFEKMGNTGLYLITGDTGSGKTTIFDAISFALFGESSGGNREPSMLRSKFANPKTKTFVELTFCYKQKTYRVKRNPEYLRPKDRGVGETSERADAVLELPDNGLVTGVKNVDDKIRQLLGVNKEQFSQIAMIAQGDFLKLLLADTKKRSEIFREIFCTGNYQQLQKELQSRSGKLKEEYDKISASIAQYLEGLRCPADYVHYEELEKIRTDRNYAASRPPVTGKMLEELCTDLKRQVKNCQRDLAKTDKEYHTIAGKLGRFKSVKEAENNLEKAAKKLTEIEERLTESRKLLDTEEGRKEEREKLSREITIKKDKLEEFDKLDELTEEVNSRQKQLQKLNEKVKEEEKEIAALQKKIMQGQEKIEQLGNAQENSLHLEQEKERLAQLAEQCREYEEDAKELDKLEKQQSRQREQYQRAAKEADESMQLALQLERAFLDGQAGILAAGLQNGKPCPVCGAVEHPNPAVFHNYIPVQEEVETAKNKAEEERTKAAELSEKIKEMEGRRTVLKQKKEICEEKLLRIWKETTGEMLELQQDTIALAQAKLAERRMQNEKNLEQTARQRQELETLKKQLPMMQQQFTEEQTRVQVDREQAVREQEGLLSLQTRREQWKEQLGFAGKKEAMQYIKRREKELSQMEAAYQKAKQDVDKETGKKKETEAEIRTLTAMVEKQKKEVGEENEERLLAEEKRLNQEKQQFSQAQEEAAMMAAEDERITQNVCRQLKKLEETDEKWQMVKSLYNTAAGNISGKDKIMLETYVQMAYFDRIINRANVHFMKMTDGRFELLRSREAGNQKSQSGLELNVLDHYYMSRNNGSRSVKSLSGGESFLAALSLALGMSEEVSANAGGIEMDAMFVDEGFGTLDESALERAVRALQELSTASRIVGIISHVPELKNRIERQIVVKKEKLKGSSTEMIS